ncbi:hypothetical protein ACEU6E_00335 [Halorutilales archaeon Cl-col2-1]
MDTVSEILEVGGDADETALRSPPVESYSWDTFTATVRKTANLASGLGLRRGDTITVSDHDTPESLFFFLGASLIGAQTVFGDGDEDATLTVTPCSETKDVSATRLCYGEKPDDPGVTHYEREIWGESPLFPSDRLSQPDDTVLLSGSRRYTQEELVTAAEEVADDYGIAEYDEAVTGSVSTPETLVAGILAPLISRTTVSLPGDGSRDSDTDTDTDSDAVLLRRGDTQRTLGIESVSIK